MKVLVIKPKIGMGDMVIYLPYIHAISKKYKKPMDMKPLIISKDNFIVDGHHRWAAAIAKFGKDVTRGIFPKDFLIFLELI